MAEFQEVVRNRNRLCAAQSNSCEGCVLDQMFGDCESGAFIDGCAAEFERIVMDWAKKHPYPKPQYPTWKEWQNTNFPNAQARIRPCMFGSDDELLCDLYKDCGICANKPIPANIAEKLGIKLKEEK